MDQIPKEKVGSHVFQSHHDLTKASLLKLWELDPKDTGRVGSIYFSELIGEKHRFFLPLGDM